jgi:hypothetical protein
MNARLAMICALALCAAPSLAQAPQPLAPTAHLGDWSFKTEPYAGECVLSGRMRISQAANGARTCRFNATETCPGKVSKAEQICTVNRAGTRVKITSKIVRTDTRSYVPDDFEVTLFSANEMRGMMQSFNSAPVVFRRSVQAIS